MMNPAWLFVIPPVFLVFVMCRGKCWHKWSTWEYCGKGYQYKTCKKCFKIKVDDVY